MSVDAALAYVARGWPVLPLRGKAPATAHGVHDATTDPELVRRWFAGEHVNVGIATGAPGPTVVDIDRPELAPALLAGLDAPTVATRQGRHVYFASSDVRSMRLPYGDLRGPGCYVCAPPSIHPSGKVYVWTWEPNGRLPIMPAELLPPPPARRAPVPVAKWIADIRHGYDDGQRGGEGRKRGLCRLAGYLLGHDIDPRLVLEMAHLVNAKSRPPLPDRDVERIVAYVARRELEDGTS